MFSDVHRHLHLAFDCLKQPESHLIQVKDYTEKTTRAKRWDYKKYEEYTNRLVEADINLMIRELDDRYDSHVEIRAEKINTIVDNICTLFDKTAKNIFGTVRSKTLIRRRNVHRTWFDENCKEKCRQFHNARKVYNRFKNEINRSR